MSVIALSTTEKLISVAGFALLQAACVDYCEFPSYCNEGDYASAPNCSMLQCVWGRWQYAVECADGLYFDKEDCVCKQTQNCAMCPTTPAPAEPGLWTTEAAVNQLTCDF